MIILFMKKYTKLFALMGVALLVGACQDDDNILDKPALPGDEIVFGATAYFKNGEPQTRTVYGDAVGDQIEVKVTEIDSMGRVNLSHRVLIPGHENDVDNGGNAGRGPRRDGGAPRRDGNRGPRRDNNGPRHDRH